MVCLLSGSVTVSLIPLSPFALITAAPSSAAFFRYATTSALVLYLVARRFLTGRCLTLRRTGEIVHGPRRVQNLLGKTSHLWRGFVVVLVFRQILGHGDQLAADLIPLRQYDL